MSEFTPLREAVDTLASRSRFPDFGELKRRARRRGRRRAAIAAVAAFAVITGSALAATDLMVTDGTGPVSEPVLTGKPLTPSATPTPTATLDTPPRNLGIPWGPAVTYYLVGKAPGGRPFADTQPWPGVDFVQSFTTTSTGVVYVNVASEIVFEGWDHQTRVLGKNPRLSMSINTQMPLLVGNPSHDLVTWATDEGERTAVMVVQASTGKTLARTVLEVATEGHVSIRALDAERLYVLIASERLNVNRTWKWSTEGSPTLRHQHRVATDVAGGVWALYEHAGSAEQGVRFETDTGRLIRRLSDFKGDEDGYLSPDGKIWFTRSDKKFVDLATGRVWRLNQSLPNFRPYFPGDIWGWTGTTEITVVIDSNSSPALVKCDALTLRCAQPLHPQQPAGAFLYLGVTLPSY